jgi:hypothetical protein
MKKLVTLSVFAFVAACLLSAPEQAQARPQYVGAVAKKFEAVKAGLDEKKCGVCHGDGGKNKKQVSDFGKAIAKALGEKNVKDEAKLSEALDKVAAMKVKEGADGTYGDLLKAGKLPEPFKE